MPHSHPAHRDVIKNYIVTNFTTDSKIVDIGAGAGTYADLLPEYKLEGVEIFEPYVVEYDLRNKYKKLYIDDATRFKYYRNYDLVIMGDVLQTMVVEHAHKVLSNIVKHGVSIIIQVPYLYVQGVCNDNVYEEHQQADLTHEVFMERYSEFSPELLASDDVCGVYVISPKSE
jgi:hypothetical protein